MAEYIDREAAINALVELTVYTDAPAINALVESAHHYQNEWIGGIGDALIEIGDLPAADVVERRMCEWLEHEVFTVLGNVDMLQSARCSKCGKYHTTPYSYYFTDYSDGPMHGEIYQWGNYGDDWYCIGEIDGYA